VDDYVKYRPHYPTAIVSYLQDEFNLTSDRLIADVGAGTGISSELLLAADYSVIAVEPNDAMREKAVELLGNNEGFKAVNGTAENTGLQNESVDAIIAGQAFHWFDRGRTKTEFARILKPDGLAILLWNERLMRTDFEKEYEQLIIDHSGDYQRVDHRNIDFDVIKEFYVPAEVTLKIFENEQRFDFEGLLGRLTSSSYMPNEGEKGFDDMKTDLVSLFSRYQENGLVIIHYETKVYAGSIAS
jgi:SAM-dependent methyltransferase